MVLVATIGGIIALIGWGLSDYLVGKSGQRADALLANLVMQFIGTAILLPIVLWFGLPVIQGTELLVVVASAAFFVIAYILFIRAMAIGPFGVAAPIGNSYPLIVLLVGLTVFHIQIAFLQLLALFTITAGVILLAADRTTLDYRKFLGSTTAFAMGTMIFWGLAFALLDLVIEKFAWYQLLFVVSLLASFFSLFFYVVLHRSFPSLRQLQYRNIPYAWYAGFVGIIAAIAFFAASQQSGSIVIPAVVASASPLVTSFLAHIRDGERLTVFKRLGAVVVVLGLVLLNL